MKIIELKKEVRTAMLGEIQRFFVEQRDETISEFNAGLLLDFMIDNIGPLLYNQAIQDAHKFMSEKTEDLFDLEKKPR